jgi:endonuclease YncB( thermonuclease family)
MAELVMRRERANAKMDSSSRIFCQSGYASADEKLAPTSPTRDANPVLASAATVRLALPWYPPDADFGALALLIWPTLDPALIEAPAFLSSEPETVDERFGRSGVDRSHACVVDGDTFRLGKRRIRIVGIDAPEVEGQCRSERNLAAAETVKLQALLNDGPFVMTGRLDDMKDRYGRDLRVITRHLPDETARSIAADMRQAGLARRYVGRKLSWC